MTAVWLALLIVTAAGIVIVCANALETGYSRASLPQVLYFLYLMTAVLLLAVGQQARMAGVLFAAVALVATVWTWWTPAVDQDRRRRAICEELKRFRQIARTEAGQPLVWETVGDVYYGLGEATLALRSYEEAARLYAAAKVVRQELFDKMKRLRSPAMAPLPDPDLGACRACGEIVKRLDFRCAACQCELFSSRALHAAVRVNRVFEGSKLDRVTATGILFLPFLYLIGPWAYVTAWGVWTLALATWRTGPRQGIA